MKKRIILAIAAALLTGCYFPSCSFLPHAEKPADPALYEAHKLATQEMMK